MKSLSGPSTSYSLWWLLVQHFLVPLKPRMLSELLKPCDDQGLHTNDELRIWCDPNSKGLKRMRQLGGHHGYVRGAQHELVVQIVLRNTDQNKDYALCRR
ncbi:hypothetical protein COP2_029631 [Malus domestica]